MARNPLAARLVAVFILVSGGLASAAQPTADPVGPEVWVKRAEGCYREHAAFRVTFRQRYISATFGAEEQAEGTVRVAGERMLWEYDKPKGQRGALADGRYWLMIPEDREVIVRDAAPGGDDLLVGLLTGRLDIAQKFLIRPGPGPVRRGGVLVELTPRETREELARATVEIDEKQFFVRRIEVVDPLGNSMFFELGAPTAAAPPPAGAFELRAPEGWTVTRQ